MARNGLVAARTIAGIAALLTLSRSDLGIAGLHTIGTLPARNHLSLSGASSARRRRSKRFSAISLPATTRSLKRRSSRR